MNNKKAEAFLAEILVNYGNLKGSADSIRYSDGGKGIPLHDDNLERWNDTLGKFYSFMEQVE